VTASATRLLAGLKPDDVLCVLRSADPLAWTAASGRGRPPLRLELGLTDVGFGTLAVWTCAVPAPARRRALARSLAEDLRRLGRAAYAVRVAPPRSP
jgi:hypothetical protein